MYAVCEPRTRPHAGGTLACGGGVGMGLELGYAGLARLEHTARA